MGSKSSTISERIDFSSIFPELGSARVLGIQLPDGLKFYSREIAGKFREKGYEVLLSGKPSYGACDIDTSLLEIVDVLLHFGHTEMVRMEGVIYVPYNIEYAIDVELLKNVIAERRIAIIGTASYAWRFDDVAKLLEDVGFAVELRRGRGVKLRGQVLGCNYTCLDGSRADAVLFIGDGRFHAVGASIYSQKKVYAYSPLSGEVEVVNTEDFVRKRYLAISRAMEGESFGIIVSTKPGQNRIALARKLQKIALEKGLSAEVLLVDEVTPAMIDNFRFDCYVNTACPRISYDDYARFSRPVITPPEFESVLGVREEFSIDFI